MGCDGSGKIFESGVRAFCEYCGTEPTCLCVEPCPGCPDCECEYWRTGRYKCGDCNACCSEANEILLRRKEGD